jgi:hypothetical protein
LDLHVILDVDENEHKRLSVTGKFVPEKERLSLDKHTIYGKLPASKCNYKKLLVVQNRG